MYRCLCDRCGLVVHIEGTLWDNLAPPLVRAAVVDRGVDLCPPCAKIVHDEMTVFVRSQGGYREV